MTTSEIIFDDRPNSITDVFADPVTYLAQHGIESRLVSEDSLRAAA